MAWVLQPFVSSSRPPRTRRRGRCTRPSIVSALPNRAATRLSPQQLRLYLVADVEYTQQRVRASLESIVERALQSGCVTAVQLRDKRNCTRATLATGRVLLHLCRQAGTYFLVNDRVDVAAALGADGVHLGQDDMPPSLARQLLPPTSILGMSAGNAAEVDEVLRYRDAESGAYLVDYIGAGPVYATGSKVDAGAAIGITGLQQVAQRAAPLPVVAIGGIHADHAAACVQSGGVQGVAVLSAILGADDPAQAARHIAQAIRPAHRASSR
ncbi:hypothetical protein CDCA_CDCA11G3159 [Cyanidium caldarium]|uniref:thiamine phosphate synthase n=1 Tax=Cyanidium caldarium TaxID=2771 RepID=A0AAV9IXZ5_CYACA|nr:hypothetical protein CDCA_CDCA11G3159 [Cyanidium caldarium]